MVPRLALQQAVSNVPIPAHKKLGGGRRPPSSKEGERPLPLLPRPRARLCRPTMQPWDLAPVRQVRRPYSRAWLTAAGRWRHLHLPVPLLPSSGCRRPLDPPSSPLQRPPAPASPAAILPTNPQRRRGRLSDPMPDMNTTTRRCRPMAGIESATMSVRHLVGFSLPLTNCPVFAGLPVSCCAPRSGSIVGSQVRPLSDLQHGTDDHERGDKLVPGSRSATRRDVNGSWGYRVQD